MWNSLFARHLSAARVGGKHGMSIEYGPSCSLRIAPGVNICILSKAIYSVLKVYCAFYQFLGNKFKTLLMEVSCVGNRLLLVNAVIMPFLMELFFCT